MYTKRGGKEQKILQKMIQNSEKEAKIILEKILIFYFILFLYTRITKLPKYGFVASSLIKIFWTIPTKAISL